jgi:hypothetical protein
MYKVSIKRTRGNGSSSAHRGVCEGSRPGRKRWVQSRAGRALATAKCRGTLTRMEDVGVWCGDVEEEVEKRVAGRGVDREREEGVGGNV